MDLTVGPGLVQPPHFTDELTETPGARNTFPRSCSVLVSEKVQSPGALVPAQWVPHH